MSNYFCTDTLDMARLEIEMTANYTIKARVEKKNDHDIVILIEVNEIGLFNSEIFVRGEENRYFDHLCNFNNINACIAKTDEFIKNFQP